MGRRNRAARRGRRVAGGMVEACERRVLLTASLPAYRGVNDFGAFSSDAGSYSSSTGGNMKGWGIDMVREDIP